MNNSQITYKPMSPTDFNAIIELGTLVHGEGYIDKTSVEIWYLKGITKTTNANYVAYIDNKLVGFRLTFSAQNWKIDEWCTPILWDIEANTVCYFKCNTVNEHYRGLGIGSTLLALSIEAVKKQGARAGVSHLWKQSPKNSAVKYFTKCGGTLIKKHPNRWLELSYKGYECPICTSNCRCEAAEMIIYFD